MVRKPSVQPCSLASLGISTIISPSKPRCLSSTSAKRTNVQFGDQHEMYRRCRMNIVKCKNLGVLIYFLTGDFSPHDFAENTVVHFYPIFRPLFHLSPTFPPGVAIHSAHRPAPGYGEPATPGSETTGLPSRVTICGFIPSFDASKTSADSSAIFFSILSCPSCSSFAT